VDADEPLTAYCPPCRKDVPVTRPAPPYSVHHDVATGEHHEGQDCNGADA
jgi:hypothetical protein